MYIRAVRGKKAEYTVIYSHGNAEDIGYEQMFIRDMAKATGMDYLVYEYPGYSLSQFTAEKPSNRISSTEQNINQASEAAWRFLVNEEKIPANRIILFGRSIGSGPTVHLASRRTITGVHESATPQHAAGVFLISPILSTVRAICNPCLAYTFCCYDKFPNHSKIKQVNATVAIMHAKDDEVVKYYNGETLSKTLGDKLSFEPLWLTEGGHNDIDPEAVLDYFLKFKEYLIQGQAPRVQTVDDFVYPSTLTEKPELSDFKEGYSA